jgi:hypothetical protein
MSLSKLYNSYLYALLDTPALPWLTLGHNLFLIGANRDQLPASLPWPQQLVAALVRCTGGSILRGLLLNKPQPALLANGGNAALASAALVWYALTYAPGSEFLYMLFKQNKYLKSLVALLEGVSKVRAIADGVDAAATVYPESWVAGIVVGTAGACGGTLLVRQKEAFGMWVPKACLCGSVLYLLLSRYGWTTRRQARFVLSLFVLWGYVGRAWCGPKVDSFAWMSKLWYWITRLPVPTAA